MAAELAKGPTWTVHASMMVLVLFWGLAFVAIKAATLHMSWITLTFVRFVLADVLFVGYLLVRKQARVRPRKQDLPALIGLAFLGFTGFTSCSTLASPSPM